MTAIFAPSGRSALLLFSGHVIRHQTSDSMKLVFQAGAFPLSLPYNSDLRAPLTAYR